ncbi:RNA polymerase sigma factor [Jannaschia rubra]|uniref:RNA polymerase sigma factor SigM n=1 Tax=Jannaschia rubra TaxID=282197 RepID=A0A0M6XWU4_9RHOB|nr:RNA polymerase sigma factor [Jannaschia rubra]CTQ34773.1 RNA polymerase sigma factor SigM [Jannaschia rubra]SFG70086.1 RNA polymerase sigma-70 factor, ECF subfamily [Jannaschia rubra]
MTHRDPREEMLDHLPALRAFALSLTRNGATADDMVQDTVVKAWTNMEKFKVGTNMRAWLFTILRNTYYSSRRKLNREVADPEGTMVASLSVKPDHDGHMNLTDFKKAFETLPDEQREALILVGASGHTYEEAADICGVAIGTIKSRANRGRARLTELLQLDGDSPLEMTDNATMAVVAGGGGVLR